MKYLKEIIVVAQDGRSELVMLTITEEHLKSNTYKFECPKEFYLSPEEHNRIDTICSSYIDWCITFDKTLHPRIKAIKIISGKKKLIVPKIKHQKSSDVVHKIVHKQKKKANKKKQHKMKERKKSAKSKVQP